MKILQISSAKTLGGGEQHVIDLTRALIERGHELHLAVRRNNSLCRVLIDFPIEWHELPLRNALDIFSARQIATIIKENKIDVIHAHVARDYPIAGIATKLSPAKLFLTRHHFNPIKSNPLYRWAIGTTTNLIAVSASVKAELVKAFPALKNRTVIIPNWVDPANIATLSKAEAREALGIKRKFAIGMIGEISPIKNQELFINAAHDLKTERIFTELDFLIIGAASLQNEDYQQRIQSLINNFDLDKSTNFKLQIKLTGKIADIKTKLAAFDIIVIPSINEGFSLVLIEAMAAGIVVIAANAGAMAEIVQNEKTGLLFEPGNSQTIARAIQRLLENDGLRKKLGMAANEHVKAQFDRNQVIDQIEKLYAGTEIFRA